MHTSVEEHKTSLQAVNARVADHLMQRFFEFRKELECAAFQRRPGPVPGVVPVEEGRLDLSPTSNTLPRTSWQATFCCSSSPICG